MTIGQRAAAAVAEMSGRKKITIEEEMENLGTTRKTHSDWQLGKVDPRAGTLQEMAFSGYDVIWILTGYPTIVPDMDFDICEYEEET